jgi:hypothetical protein
MPQEYSLKMLDELKKFGEIVDSWWARSMVAIILCVIGYNVGAIQTEIRIASDCKFANAFRVDIQAFSCQRKL